MGTTVIKLRTSFPLSLFFLALSRVAKTSFSAVAISPPFSSHKWNKCHWDENWSKNGAVSSAKRNFLRSFSRSWKELHFRRSDKKELAIHFPIFLLGSIRKALNGHSYFIASLTKRMFIERMQKRYFPSSSVIDPSYTKARSKNIGILSNLHHRPWESGEANERDFAKLFFSPISRPACEEWRRSSTGIFIFPPRLISVQ